MNIENPYASYLSGLTNNRAVVPFESIQGTYAGQGQGQPQVAPGAGQIVPPEVMNQVMNPSWSLSSDQINVPYDTSSPLPDLRTMQTQERPAPARLPGQHSGTQKLLHALLGTTFGIGG